MSISENLKQIKEELDAHNCLLVAVSKTKPATAIQEAYEAGHRDFGENKVQEMTAKYEELPKDIRWHMIGHLQRNKVKYLAPYVHLIHGVDSPRLLREIDKQAAKAARVIKVLLQIHIAREESKFGFDEQELLELLDSEEMADLKNIQVCGLMGMATNTEKEATIREEFAGLRALFEKVKASYDLPNVQMEELSMGMSGDYTIALAEGSTMVRIGSAIFGARDYH